jgi:hypothetical protein
LSILVLAALVTPDIVRGGLKLYVDLFDAPEGEQSFGESVGITQTHPVWFTGVEDGVFVLFGFSLVAVGE